MKTDLSPPWRCEMKILLLCGRAELDPDRTEELRGLIREPPDWERLFRMADFNGLLPLLYRHLNGGAADLVPVDQLSVCRRYFHKNAEHVLRLTAELIKILSHLREHGILAVPYKGPALAARLYGHVVLRQIGDLDILVARRDVLATEALLEQSGFRIRYPMSSDAREFVFRRRYNDRLEKDGRLIVELHWGFASAAVGFPLELDQLRERLGEINLGGVRLPDFGADDLLLILCAHGAKDCWYRLEWLTGVAELVRKEAISWPTVIGRAADLRAGRTLLLGVLLAHDLLDAPVPIDVVEAARSERDVMRLAAIVQQRFAHYDGTEPGERPLSLRRDRFRLWLQPTYRDRLRYLFYRFTTPRREDTRWIVPVGTRSMPLRTLIRPFRVIGKGVRSLSHRSRRRKL
jgi:hypothetical protein